MRAPAFALGWQPHKIAAVQALGAERSVATARPRSARPVRAATGGRGVDAVIDTTGGPLFGDHAWPAPDGRLVTCGAHAGEVVHLVALFRRGHRVLGFRVASPAEIRTALTMALDGRIQVPLTGRSRCRTRERRMPTWRSAGTSKIVPVRE